MNSKNLKILAGPTIAIVVAFLAHRFGGLDFRAASCLFAAVVCALWWMTEAVHIAVAGLVPFVVFPLTGVMDHKSVAAGYGDSMILLLLGGFFLSRAMERSGAHRRIAVLLVRFVGAAAGDADDQAASESERTARPPMFGSGKRVILGFMLACALLSMWISNTATALMMLPIAMAVLTQVRDTTLRVPLLLGIAYASSVGGMATPIGTPPNVMAMGELDKFDVEISFFRWMKLAVPIVCVLIPVLWLWLTRNVKTIAPIQMPAVGPISTAEIRVLAVFTATALLWVFRSEPMGGWNQWLPGAPDMANGKTIGDATVALGASLLLFLIPAGAPIAITSPGGTDDGQPPQPDEVDDDGGRDNAVPQRRLLEWSDVGAQPWGILLMFGGGLALAKGFSASGLSKVIGDQLTFLSDQPDWLIVAVICVTVSLLTELTSSTATTALLLPILFQIALAAEMDPVRVIMPATICASCAFMLPVATAPNVIVFGTGFLSTSDMIRQGILMNFVAVTVIVILSLLLI
ncbi:MAG: SLC13 family permease [Planctomycetota bacterium]